MYLRPLRVAAAAAIALSGCALEPELPAQSEDFAVSVLAIGSGTCNAPSTNALSDITSLKVEVRGLNIDTGTDDLLASASGSLSGGTFRLGEVPVGNGRSVLVRGNGATATWYGCDPSVNIAQGQTTSVNVLLAPHGEPACVDTATTAANTVFPASATLGDGTVMITGGFTAVVSASGKTHLEGASDQAFIFDPRTGGLTALGSMGANQGRAGHAMVYIPSTGAPGDAGRVLIYGGLKRLEVNEAKAFPFIMNTADARSDYIIYDIATKAFSARGIGTGGVTTGMPKRGFPQAHLLADSTVVITGGGDWPLHAFNDDYKNVVIYDPISDALLPIQNWQSFWPRAGHTLSFIRNETSESSSVPLSRLLVWGGTPERADRPGAVAEILKQSGNQRDGINGTFAPVTVTVSGGGAPAFSYFHETTPLGGNQFLVTGGVREKNGVLEPARDDEAWLLKYVSDEGGETVHVKKVPGLGSGRFFHQAVSSNASSVTVMGGFDGPSAVNVDKVKFFDLNQGATWTTAPEANLFNARGGFVAVQPLCGTALLLGGAGQLSELEGNDVLPLYVEVYTPSITPLP